MRGLVMDGGMMFGHVVTIVFFARGPVVPESSAKILSRSQWYFMSINFIFLRTLSLMTPSAVVLSVCIGDGS